MTRPDRSQASGATLLLLLMVLLLSFAFVVVADAVARRAAAELREPLSDKSEPSAHDGGQVAPLSRAAGGEFPAARSDSWTRVSAGPLAARGAARPRTKRLAGRQARPRVQLAQRPQKSTTTSTTTTTTSTTSAVPATPEIQPDQSDESDDSAGLDYEDIQGAKKVKSAAAGDGAAPVAEEEEPADGDEEAEAGPSPTAAPTTTSTTSTTQRSATRVSPATKSKSSAARRKPKTGNTSARPAAGESKATNARERPEPGSSAPVVNGTEADGLEPPATPPPPPPPPSHRHRGRKQPIVALPFLRPKNASVCTREAYLEFPADLVGNKWRGRGLVVLHIGVVCYMFYCLALVCERYFMPSLEEFALRLNLSEDVAGATLMSAGSSAPELFTAILGVFVAKGDVGTGTIVGSAVFNILFVIGLCGFVSTTSAQLQWWPVLRDSVYYAFTVLVLIIFIYDEEVTALESAAMLALYGVYILVMVHNEALKERASQALLANPLTAGLFSSAGVAGAAAAAGPDDVFGSSSSAPRCKTVEEDSMYLAACLVIVKHRRLFGARLRFQAAARYVIVKRQHRARRQQQASAKSTTGRSDEVNYFGPESEPLAGSANQRARHEAFARSSTLSKQKFSIVSKDDYEFWNRPPLEGENYYLWLAKIPVNYVLHYTVPDCALYPDRYLVTFFASIAWTALFSYVMVWMVTLIGFTLGIPDSVMGATFLAAGTSVPDCYSSIHAARNGMADMAVSNSIGSNVFDILVGLALPWFIQTALYPGVVATISSRGIIYSVVLLFLSLVITIYLLNKFEWTLKPRLGLALLITYGLFIALTCMLEFNLFGHVNPPACPV